MEKITGGFSLYSCPSMHIYTRIYPPILQMYLFLLNSLFKIVHSYWAYHMHIYSYTRTYVSVTSIFKHSLCFSESNLTIFSITMMTTVFLVYFILLFLLLLPAVLPLLESFVTLAIVVICDIHIWYQSDK